MAPTFCKGSPIFHPIHGAGMIKDITTKIILEEEKQYYVIELPHNELHEVMVPVSKASSVGLRNINPKKKIEKVFEILQQNDEPDQDTLVKSFYQRYREYVAKVQSGEIFEVANVFKLLYLRNLIKPLGMKDKNLFEMAEHLLVSEMGFSLDVPRDRALARLRTCMEDTFSPPGEEEPEKEKEKTK
ncbi:CarD family transcriptional regulator [Candidatus Riflebacteria bacterium]